MSAAMNEEAFFKILMESAILRLGEGRAKVLEASIRSIARSLASIAQHPLELEEEPAFFG